MKSMIVDLYSVLKAVLSTFDAWASIMIIIIVITLPIGEVYIPLKYALSLIAINAIASYQLSAMVFREWFRLKSENLRNRKIDDAIID